MNSDYIKNLEASQMRVPVSVSRYSKELLLRDRVEATERLSQLESSQTVLA